MKETRHNFAARRNRATQKRSATQTETRPSVGKFNRLWLQAIAKIFQWVPWKQAIPKIAIAGIAILPLVAGNDALGDENGTIMYETGGDRAISNSPKVPNTLSKNLTVDKLYGEDILFGIGETANIANNGQNGGTDAPDLGGYTITVGGTTPSTHAAGFLYGYSDPYAVNLGSTTASGEIKVIADGGFAAGAVFLKDFMPTDLMKSKWGDIADSAKIHLGDITVSGGTATGFTANSSSGEIVLGDINVTGTDGTADSSGLYLKGKISGGSITTGNITTKATDSTGSIYGVVIGEYDSADDKNNQSLFSGTLTTGAVTVNAKQNAYGIEIHGKANQNLVINGMVEATVTDTTNGNAYGVRANVFDGTVFQYNIEATGGKENIGILADGEFVSSNIILDTSTTEKLKITGTTASIQLAGIDDTLTITGGNAFTNNGTAFTTDGAETIDFKTNATLETGSTLTGTKTINVADGKTVTIKAGQTFDELTSSIGDSSFLKIDGTLNVKKNTNVIGDTGTFHVTGAAIFGGAANFGGAVNFDDSVELQGNTVFQGIVKQETNNKNFTVAAGKIVSFQEKVTLQNIANSGTMKFNGTTSSSGAIPSTIVQYATGGKIQVYGSAEVGAVAITFTDDVGVAIAFGEPQRDQFVEWYFDDDNNSIKAGRTAKAQIQDTYFTSLLLHNRRSIWQATTSRFNYFIDPSQNAYRGQSPTVNSNYHSLWGNYIGRSGFYESGFNGSNFELRANGLQVGLDLFHSRSNTLGVMFGYEGQRSYLHNDRIEANDYYFGLYGGRVFDGGIDLRGWFGYGRQSYESTREALTSGMFHHASFDGNTFEGTLEIGRRFYVTSCASFRPVFGVDLYHNEIDGATEDGIAASSVIYDGATLRQAYLRFGSDVQIQCNRWDLTSGLYYSIDLASDRITAATGDQSANTALLNSSKLGSSLFTVNISGEYFISKDKNVSLFASYYGDIYIDRAGTPYSNTLLAGLQAKF